jgi:NAD(P)-dependent dehydrogenase (short-subunit alcohol dehydrogenase family)
LQLTDDVMLVSQNVYLLRSEVLRIAPLGNIRQQRACMRVLFKGPYFLTRSLLPFLADGGSIVNVTTNAIFQQGYTAYASMKGGRTVLTSYMAKEFSARQIRVNSVAPGLPARV